MFFNKKIHDRNSILQKLRNIRMTWRKCLHENQFENIRIQLIEMNVEDINFGFQDSDIQQIKKYYKS